MKKLKTPLNAAACLFMLLLSFQSYAQSQAASWNYPVKPGTAAWTKLASYEERLAAYNIPETTLKSVSTGSLVKICLNYPEWRLVNTRNSVQQGYDYLKTIFNGFTELESRPDAGTEIIKVYRTMRPETVASFATGLERGNYMFSLIYVELLLSQKAILVNLKDKKSLTELSIKNYETKKAHGSEYGTFGLMTSALILGRTLDVQQDASLSRAKSENNGVDYFLSNGIGYDLASLDAIVALSKASIRK
jgi:hypothetical protein